jgi:hypothetical protein
MALGIHLYVRRQTRKMEKRHREAIEKEKLETELRTAGEI